MPEHPVSYLQNENHTPDHARYPAVDAHNHLWGAYDLETTGNTLDATGIVAYCDLTANARVEFAEGGYTLASRSIDEFFAGPGADPSGRYYCFTMAEFAKPTGSPLCDDLSVFAENCARTLEAHVAQGAKGLKVLKELGLAHRDQAGDLIRLDDPRLTPVWDAAADLGVPVLIHQSDPYGFFEPAVPGNEHYESLEKFPSWSFADSRFPRKRELLERRDRLVANHPNTTFILPHVANFAENVGYVDRLLTEHPNVMIDFSARIDELGRQPYSSRELFLTHQDRILFGTDMPANIESSIEMYRCYFRFLETFDEGFYPPDYDGTFDRARWSICGIGLPDEVLEKIYRLNAKRIIPGLA